MALAIALLATGAVAFLRRPSDAPAKGSPSPLGDTLPWLMLMSPEGERVSLHDRLKGRPALIYVVNEAECASCSNLALEFRIVRREIPMLQPLLIGSGSPPRAFAPHLEQMNLTSSALIDEHRSLLRALSIEAEPLALVVDSAGRILFVDLRSTSKAAQFPMGHLLHGLRSVLCMPGNCS